MKRITRERLKELCAWVSASGDIFPHPEDGPDDEPGRDHEEEVCWVDELLWAAMYMLDDHDEAEKLRERRDALLITVRNLSQTAIDQTEADELTGQIAALIAEVGTLRASNARLVEPPVCGKCKRDIDWSKAMIVPVCDQCTPPLPALQRKAAAIEDPFIWPNESSFNIKAGGVELPLEICVPLKDSTLGGAASLEYNPTQEDDDG